MEILKLILLFGRTGGISALGLGSGGGSGGGGVGYA